MGIQQMVSGLTQNIRKNNTTNARLARDVLRRATSIAADLERSEKVEDKTKLTRVTAILEQTSEQFKIDPNKDDLGHRMDVETHYTRRVALIAADAELDKIQPPPDNRIDILREAVEKDNENYKAELKAMCEDARGSIQQVLRILPTKAALQDPRVREKLKEIMKQDDSFRELWELSSSVWEVMGDMVQHGVIDEQIVVHITNLDRPDDRAATQSVYPHQTLGELSISCDDEDDEEPEPDFFVKKSDKEKNQCTKSGYWWQHQPPDVRVCDALVEDEHKIKRLDIVKRKGQYIIALVNDNGTENGKPLDLPLKKSEQKPVSESVKNFFTGRNIVKVSSLDGKEDIAEKLWSKKTFMPCSNPLYIELGEQTRREDGCTRTARVATA